MSCKNYRVIEMQNDDIGAVAVNGYIPFGRITRRIATATGNGVPFQVASSGADIISITNKGYYKVIYNASLKVADAGTIEIALIANGNKVYSVKTTAAGAGTFNVTLPKEIRVFSNCSSCSTNCPVDIQIQNIGVAVTGGNSNIIVDSCNNG